MTRTAAGHVQSIDVGSMSFGVSAGSVPADPSFAPLVVDASISQASPLLFEAAAAGTVFPTITLTRRSSSQGEPDELRGVDAQQRRRSLAIRPTTAPNAMP